MTSFSFVDAVGASWMVFPGLPASHPDADVPGPLSGLTFYAATGETRVLPLRGLPRASSADIVVAPFGTGPRLAGPALDWIPLLACAVPWSAGPGSSGADSSAP